MKASLQLRLSQRLALTPQLQQSIRLLQLSTLELQQEVAMAISQNPLLENEDEWIEGPLREEADGSVIAQTPGASAPADPMAGNGSASSDGNGERAESGEPQGVDEYNGLAAGSGGDSSLRAHLMAQLRVTHASQRDRALITFLIESLDGDGYLAAKLEEVLADLPEELEVDLDELNAALALLHSFDPPGVGARSASECLKLQLLRLDPSPTRTLALDIVGHYLELLAARDFTHLRKQLKVSDDALRDAHALIRSLELFPGASYGNAEADYVVPDIIVRKTEQGWQAELNPEVMPKLRINHLYANILRNNRGDPGSGSLRQQLQEARWLIKNIQQRFETILRVAQAIVERQTNFFAHGEIAMRPLVLREIADVLGLHESTVSRVTTGKYMLTPFGTLEFKCFFGSHGSTDTGDAASPTAIQALQPIRAEDPETTLSDSLIAELLAEQGFVVVRVASSSVDVDALQAALKHRGSAYWNKVYTKGFEIEVDTASCSSLDEFSDRLATFSGFNATLKWATEQHVIGEQDFPKLGVLALYESGAVRSMGKIKKITESGVEVEIRNRLQLLDPGDRTDDDSYRNGTHTLITLVGVEVF